MNSVSRILFPTNFSAYTEYTLPYVKALAHQFHSVTHVLHVIDPANAPMGDLDDSGLAGTDFDYLREALEMHAKERLDALLNRAASQGMEVRGHLDRGKVIPTIIDSALTLSADLIVLSTHGRTGLDRLIYGSICEQIVSRSPIPILTIKHPEHEFVREEGAAVNLKRVLCPCDFSEFSRSVVPIAAMVCREFDAELELCHVVNPHLDYAEFMGGMEDQNSPRLLAAARSYLDALVAQFPDLNIVTDVSVGLPYREIVHIAERNNIDLLVMATHGRTGLAHTLAENVTEHVVRLAPCPVLTFHPQVTEKVPEADRVGNKLGIVPHSTPES